MNGDIIRRPGHRPKKPYIRPVREQIVKICLTENRRPTKDDLAKISSEAHALAKAGYYLLSILDEDQAVLEHYFPDPDATKDDGSIGGYDLSL